MRGGQDKRDSIDVKGRADAEGDGKIAEAGKVWAKGYNWTIVVLEVVCARIGEGAKDRKGRIPGDWEAGKTGEAEEEEAGEDDDVLEIPVFVRVEFEVDVAGDDAGAREGKEMREKRELNYWCVLGVGRIAKSAV